MTTREVKICSRCDMHNPKSNDYCRKCGGPLGISTTIIKAQPSLIWPADKGVKWRWAFLGALIILGLMTLLLGILAGFAWVTLGIAPGAGIVDLGSVMDEFLGLSVAAAALFLLAFGFGGMAIAWFSRRYSFFESAIAALLVIALFGIAGSALTGDALVIAAVMVIPSVLLAAIGARIGSLFSARDY